MKISPGIPSQISFINSSSGFFEKSSRDWVRNSYRYFVRNCTKNFIKNFCQNVFGNFYRDSSRKSCRNSSNISVGVHTEIPTRLPPDVYPWISLQISSAFRLRITQRIFPRILRGNDSQMFPRNFYSNPFRNISRVFSSDLYQNLSRRFFNIPTGISSEICPQIATWILSEMPSAIPWEIQKLRIPSEISPRNYLEKFPIFLRILTKKKRQEFS